MVVVGSRFYYGPVIASHETANYHSMHPDHHQWLTERKIEFRVSNFIWPDMLGAILHNAINARVCELLVEIDDPEAAIAFTDYLSNE